MHDSNRQSSMLYLSVTYDFLLQHIELIPKQGFITPTGTSLANKSSVTKIIAFKSNKTAGESGKCQIHKSVLNYFRQQ